MVDWDSDWFLTIWRRRGTSGSKAPVLFLQAIISEGFEDPMMGGVIGKGAKHRCGEESGGFGVDFRGWFPVLRPKSPVACG